MIIIISSIFFGLVDICISIISNSDPDDDKADDDKEEEEDGVDYTWCILQRTRHITTKLTQKLEGYHVVLLVRKK